MEGVTKASKETVEMRQKIFTQIPDQPGPKEGQLTKEQLQQFFEKGYLVLQDFFPIEKLEACRKDISKLVDDLANSLYKTGKIKNLHKEHDFFTRLIHINQEFPGANIILHKNGEVPPAVRNLWTDRTLLNVVEQIIGPDIMGHPVWNLRTKVPNNEATVVPWHQDVAYLDDRAPDVMQVTAWIPFIDADEVNGTLQVAEGAHKQGRVAKHVCCYRGTWYVEIEEEELAESLSVDLKKDIKTCIVPYGSVLLFSNMLPHRSLPNLSDKTRWSVDLRWQTPHKNPGFYDVKKGIVFRTKENPDLVPDWETFNANMPLNKVKLDQMEVTNPDKDPFDTTLTGPWMERWEIVNVNKHVEGYRSKKTIDRA